MTELSTILAFLREKGIDALAAGPLPDELFCSYADWFRESYGLEHHPIWIEQLLAKGGVFEAQSAVRSIEARCVVIALGFEPFAYVPPELASLLPPRS